MRGAYGQLFAIAARDYAIGAAAGPFLPTVLKGMAVRRSARQIFQGFGTAAVDRRRPLVVVGGEWFHSTADKERAITILTTDFQAVTSDLAGQAIAHPSPAVAQWLSAFVTPLLTEWKDFAEKQAASWWVRAATEWSAYENWEDRLRQLRELARAHGIALKSPEPTALPKTVWQQGAEGRGSEAASWLGVLKIGVFFALGVTGIAALYSVLHNTRSRS